MNCPPNFFGQQTWDTTQTKPLAMSFKTVTPYRCLAGHLQQCNGRVQTNMNIATTLQHFISNNNLWICETYI